MEQRVGEGWRCDGCGVVGRWSPSWRTYQSIFEADEGLLRWVACSKACMALMPKELKAYEIRPHPFHGLPDGTHDRVEALRTKAGWRANAARGGAGRLKVER